MQTKGFWLTSVVVILLLVVVTGTSLGLTVPDTFTLNDPGKLYEPFKFNHAKHVQLLMECSNCHHHTTGTLEQDANCVRCHRNSGETKMVSCKGCHLADPFTAAAMKEKNPKAYHLDKPSLKAAMHRNCIGCHEKMKGPVGCRDCHRRSKEGDAFYNSGAFAPKSKPAKDAHDSH